MTISVTLESELPTRWRKFCVHLADGIHTSVQRAVEEGAQEARTLHRYKDRTGNLTRSIRARMDSYNAYGAVGTIEATAPYASFVEEGTHPHDIRPKEGHGFIGPLQSGQSRRAKTDIGTHRVALRWYSGGTVHFAAVVHHPGSKSMPFMGPAFLRAERVLEASINAAIAHVGADLER